MEVASLVRLYFPLPPTPINRQFPLDYLNTLQILDKCYMASIKKIKCICCLAFSML